ncbi:uncharacterized protein J7T54_002232 [Emericellopsis cladophorae]|uniref:Uncharacterized protein n=1 Tax=Emericellopsis cladophorae TaxID=2686198 RepID=A0A9Q0BE80_9HYPO|nr:uncharacterized protein J7T54_002232 [Emericellopsis cladophorae]KAI6781340.1 hypothetical protein J7T54_002232 [Emericellopsis cladophorae]
MKPPGVPKTLHQLREEKREQEEHAEAMRREALQQELAAAEGTEGPEGEMDDVQLDGAADLDDEVPEAGEDFMMDDDDEDVSEEEASDQSSEQGEEEYPALDEEALREERQNDLIAARMRMTDDAYREALIRGDPDGDDMYGGQEEVQENLEGHMLDEEDLVGVEADDDADLGMDADLDDDIPEAEHSFGGYEHTDSEAELSSSENEPLSDDAAEEEQQEGEEDVDDEEDDSDDFAPRTVRMAEPQSPTMRGVGTLGASRLSMDISGILSQDESSFMDSSPAEARRARYG